MVDNEKFIHNLDTALDRQRDHLDSVKLPKVKENFDALRGTFENFYIVLLRKSLIREDPYKLEHKFSEIELPPNDPVTESEKTDQISMRMSYFDSQLTFLQNYYQFTVDFLSLKRIKLLAGLTKFVNWDNLSAASTHVNTRLVGELLSKIRGGSDSFAIQVINNAQNQMARTGENIVAWLKELTRYHRERYKLEVRNTVTNLLDINPTMVQSDKGGTLALVKKRFASSMHGMPFYGELIEEILEEDYGINSDVLQGNVLKSLDVVTEKAQQKKTEDHRGYIFDSMRILAGSGKSIGRAIVKLNESSTIVEEYRKKQHGPLRRFLDRILLKSKEVRIYEVAFVDPATSVERTMSINFDDLYKRGIATAKKISAFSSRNSPGFAKIESLSGDALYAMLERNVADVQRLARSMPALHDHFQAEMDKLGKGKLRGIRLEINAIRNAMLKANQRRHEYVSRKEEQEQLKRLGIKS